MIFRPYCDFETGCTAQLFGCDGLGKCAVVDAHADPGHFAGSVCGAINHGREGGAP